MILPIYTKYYNHILPISVNFQISLVFLDISPKCLRGIAGTIPISMMGNLELDLWDNTGHQQVLMYFEVIEDPFVVLTPNRRDIVN